MAAGLNECNYITHGNYDALGNVHLCKKMLRAHRPEPGKVAASNSCPAADGILLAEVINDFTEKIKELGPLGKGEG